MAISTLKQQLNNSTTYEDFIEEKTINKKKFWNHSSKKMYVPALKYSFKKLKELVDDGADVDEIMERYV